MLLLSFAFGTLLTVGALAAPLDGPYVVRGPGAGLEAWTVESAAGGLQKQTRPVAADCKGG